MLVPSVMNLSQFTAKSRIVKELKTSMQEVAN